MIIDNATGGPSRNDLATPKRLKKTQTEDDNVNIQTNDKSLDEHDLNLDDEGGTYVGEVYIPPIAATCFADPTGPRLIITKIVAFNFKSYAGYVTLGPFNTRFNATIGPNGSGKSNVIDSMLFVFGYRASKIRANKLSVLMHKSNQVGGVSRCSVTIHFAQVIDKPNEGFELIPGTELEIARTAFYDNSSFYTLNGKKVHFKEVAQVLRTHGVDLLNNRFLILQGEVEQISMMAPKGKTEKETGLLEYLEEIIGTNRYKEPILQMEVLYGKFNDERTEKLTRVHLVETDLKALEPELRKAVNFLELENRVQMKHNEICQLKRYGHVKALQELEAKAELMDRELGADLEIVKKCTEEMDEAKSELRTVEREMGEKDVKLAQVESWIEKARITVQRLNAEQRETEKRDAKAKEELKKEETKLRNLERVPEKNKAEIESLEEEKAKLTELKADMEDRLTRVLATIALETGPLQDKKNELQCVQIGLRKELDEAKSKCDIAQSELEIYLSTQSKETKRLAELESNLEKVTATLKERQATCEQLSTRIPDLESEILASKARLADLTREETALTESIRALSREVGEKRESMQVNRSADRMGNFVMQLKTENRVSGILGRLGDLGGIDAKYDVAVSTACGALGFVVTETVEAGEAVIAAVKRQNVGRVNVIPLDKMAQYHNKCYQKYKTPENVPRLIDLITVQDERLRVAFYYATRETLVAADLTQAKRIGYSGQGYRLVTLDGAIVEPSGTMTGGGNQPIRGQMGRKATVSTDANLAVDLEAKEKQMAAMETELKILAQRRMEVETSLNCTTNELKYKKQEFATCQIDVKSLAQQAPDLSKQIATQQVTLSKVNIDQTKRHELETKVAELTDMLNEKRTNADQLEAKVSAVHEKIMAISSGKTSELNTDLSQIGAKLDKTKSTINKLHAGINANNRDVKKSSDKVANLREEISETEAKLEAIRGKLEQYRREQGEHEARAEQCRAELNEVRKRFGALKEAFDANNEELDKVQAKIKTATKDLTETRVAMETTRAVVSKLEKKIASLKLHELLEITQADGFIEVKTCVSDPLRTITEEELGAKTEEDLRKELESIQAHFPEEVPNLAVVENYKKTHELYMRRVSELQATTQERNKYRKGIMDTQKRRTHEFNSAFQLIADKVKETYQLLTTYGSADMSLDDNLNPFSQGINYAIRPPMKSWKAISNLSGGEKTIASLALVFALHCYKPSPLYFLDEIDAALDVRNVAIIGHYIKERTVNAQFIIISLRPECFDLADRIIGIYKVFNKSNSIAVDPKCLDVLNPHYKPYVRPDLNQAPCGNPQEKPVASGENVEKIGEEESEKDEEAVDKSPSSDKENQRHNEGDGESTNRVKGAHKVRKVLLKVPNSDGNLVEDVDDASNEHQGEKSTEQEDTNRRNEVHNSSDDETGSRNEHSEDIPYRKRAHRKRKSTEENQVANEESKKDDADKTKEPESKRSKPSHGVNQAGRDDHFENAKGPERKAAKQKHRRQSDERCENDDELDDRNGNQTRVSQESEDDECNIEQDDETTDTNETAIESDDFVGRIKSKRGRAKEVKESDSDESLVGSRNQRSHRGKRVAVLVEDSSDSGGQTDSMLDV